MFDSGDWGVGTVWVWDGEYGEVGWDFGGDYCGISDFGVVGAGVEALSMRVRGDGYRSERRDR